jgi:hypothetical protein
MHAQDAADAHGVEPAVVDQTTNRLRMNPELSGDVSHTDQTTGFSAYRRHNRSQPFQVPAQHAWPIASKAAPAGPRKLDALPESLQGASSDPGVGAPRSGMTG